MQEEKLNSKLNIGKEEIRKVVMTADEKNRIFENIMNSPVRSSKSVRSPYSFVSALYHNKAVYYAVVSSFVVFVGGGVALASTGSLPGNILYPVKVNVVEPLHSALTFSTQARAEYESSLATERLVEAETLANEGKLDKSKEDKLNLLLANHTEALNKSLDKLRRSSEDEDADDEIVTEFQARMNAHARMIGILSNNGSRDSDKEEDNEISKTARDRANKIRDALKKKKYDDSGKYTKKRTSVQSLIDSTDTDIIRDDKNQTSSKRRRVFEDTHKTLDRAKDFLKESEEHDKKGDLESAYSSLLDSESSAKEAGILMRAGLKLSPEND